MTVMHEGAGTHEGAGIHDGAGGSAEPGTDALSFPSVAWFEALTRSMHENRARFEHLGFIDCVARFTVLDAGPDNEPVSIDVAFEVFDAVDVREGSGPDDRVDFELQGTLSTWREMIESIAAGSGRPALEQTLNRLSNFGTPLRLVADDPLRADLYFRYNQSLQEFVNASAAFTTLFVR